MSFSFKKFSLLLFLLSVFLISFLPTKDPDFGWHYRCGAEVLKGNLSVCTNNNFSYFLPDYRSFYPGTLYDTTLAFVYNNFGFIGVSLLGSAVITITAFFFVSFSKAPLWANFISFYLYYFLSRLTLGIGLRPQIISLMFFALTVYILSGIKKNPKSAFFIPLIFVIWVNVHIGFFVGLILVFLYFFENIRTKLFPILVTASLFSLGATFLNSYGINVYREIFNHATAGLNTLIAEWVGPVLPDSILIAASSISVILLMIKNRSVTLFSFLLILFFGYLGLQARRNVPLYYLSFFYVLLNQKYFEGKLRTAFSSIDHIVPTIIISIIAVTLIISVPATLKFDTSWEEYCFHGMATYPCRAIEKYPGLAGNVYSIYEWGGFLIWKKPKIKIFVDGRMPAWKDSSGQSPYLDYLYILQTRDGWNERLRDLKTDYLLIAPKTFIGDLLTKNSEKYGWRQVYRDDSSIIYKSMN